MVIQYCSPTLAGMKTGNLFNCPYHSIYDLMNDIEVLNYKLNCKGVYICILKYEEDWALIYVYRPIKLIGDLSKKETERLLIREGYDCKNVLNCINRLSSRLCENTKFPHEIGLFLGYPLSDVIGFIKNKGRNYKNIGCWKVYHDEYNAEKTFQKYRKCTEVYCRKKKEGLTLQRLTVLTQ